MSNIKKEPVKAETKEDVKASEIVKTEEKEPVKAETKEDVKASEKSQAKQESYIMKVTHLSWGHMNKNHFYASKKPLITAKVMGEYASTLEIWLKAGWIEKGSYK